MKNLIPLSFVLMMFTVTSCEAIGDIFSAGFYTGLFVVVAVIALLFWLIGRRR
jgi:TRAP-type C4-dicarboxylate transport system permease large subunit